MNIKNTSSTKGRAKSILNQFMIYIVLVALVAVISILKPAFLSTVNILNVIRQISFIAIIALGVLGVLITTGMDLSSSSVVGLTAVVFASVSHPGDFAPIVSVLISLMVGITVGALNGVMVAKFNIPAFIATLSTQTAVRGFAMIYSGGKPIGNIDERLVFLGGGKVLGIPVPIIILVIMAVTTHIMLTWTRYGRYVFAIGGNENAARNSGLHVNRIKIITYVYAGFMASLAGIILTARVQSGQPGAGSGFELDAIAAAVIGGTSLSGGVGTVAGTIAGALIIGVINNGLDLMNVNTYWQSVAKGVVIALAVFIDRKRASARAAG